MKKLITIALFVFLVNSYSIAENSKLSYIVGSQQFFKIIDINRESEAWATCSAAYEIMSVIFKSSPAQSKQYKDLSRGASLAVMMTHVNNGLTSDITPERFRALWKFSQSLVTSIPETRKTMILADAEILGDKGEEQFISKVAETIKICISNLKGQQAYIDTWREMAKSGLLE